MIRPRIEPQSPEPLAKTPTARPMAGHEMPLNKNKKKTKKKKIKQNKQTSKTTSAFGYFETTSYIVYNIIFKVF